jgi:hypothetical protein
METWRRRRRSRKQADRQTNRHKHKDDRLIVTHVHVHVHVHVQGWKQGCRDAEMHTEMDQTVLGRDKAEMDQTILDRDKDERQAHRVDKRHILPIHLHLAVFRVLRCRRLHFPGEIVGDEHVCGCLVHAHQPCL